MQAPLARACDKSFTTSTNYQHQLAQYAIKTIKIILFNKARTQPGDLLLLSLDLFRAVCQLMRLDAKAGKKNTPFKRSAFVFFLPFKGLCSRPHLLTLGAGILREKEAANLPASPPLLKKDKFSRENQTPPSPLQILILYISPTINSKYLSQNNKNILTQPKSNTIITPS